MSPANKVTVLRIATIPVILVAASLESGPAGISGDWGQVLALALIVLASITDGIDGYLARKYGGSRFGKIMDPMADKLLIMLILAVDAGRPEVTRVFPWMVCCVITREIIILTLRIYSAESGCPLESNFLGKLKTAFQMAAVIAVHLSLVLRAYRPLSPGRAFGFFETLDLPVTVGLLWISMILTVASALVYLKQNWKIIREGLAS